MISEIYVVSSYNVFPLMLSKVSKVYVQNVYAVDVLYSYKLK